MKSVYENRDPEHVAGYTHFVVSHIIYFDYLYGGCGTEMVNCTDKEAIEHAKSQVRRNNQIANYSVMRSVDKKVVGTFRMITEYTEDLG